MKTRATGIAVMQARELKFTMADFLAIAAVAVFCATLGGRFFRIF